jgi:Fe(3+) dicitrate transport protein
MKKIFILGLLGISGMVQAQDSTKVRQMEAVTVSGRKAVPERLPAVEGLALFAGKKNEVIRLSAIDANLATNNARQLFGRVPGVSIWENDGSGTQVSVAVRGLSPNRSWEFNTRQNGYDISSDVFGYPEAYYNPPMEAVERIQIVRGGASLQYGSQFGGLLNYELKRETKQVPFTFQSQTTVGSYGMLGTYNAIGGNTSRLSYYAYHHYRKGNGWRENGQYEVQHSHAYMKYKLSASSTLSAEYTHMNYALQQSGGLTDVQFQENHRQSLRARNWFSTPWNLAALNFDTKLGERVSINMKIFGLLGQRNSIGFVATPDVKDTINLALKDYNHRQVDRDRYKNIGAELRGIFTYELFHQPQHLAFGARVYKAHTIRQQRGKGDTGVDFNTRITTDPFPVALDFGTQNLALFAEHAWQLQERLTITTGLRFEHLVSNFSGRIGMNGNTPVNAQAQSATRNFVLGGIGLEYKWKATNFYANISQAYRPVLFSDLVPPATTDSIDAKLKDADGFNADLGFRGAIADWLNFDLSVFYIQYNDKPGTIRRFTGNDPTAATYQFRTNLGDAVHKGIETYIDIRLSRLLKMNNKKGDINLFASLAFIRAEYIDFKTTKISGTAPNITLTEENLAHNKVENAPGYIHNIGITYAVKGFSATAQTRITAAVFSDATNTSLPVKTGVAGKIAGYSVYDLSMEYQFGKNYHIRFSINNITDTKYATRRAGGYPGPGLIPGEGRTVGMSMGIKL